MEKEEDDDTSTWEQRIQAVTHILTPPTTSPPLHAQLLISTQLVPRYLKYWDYPPSEIHQSQFLTNIHWGFFYLYLNRLKRLGLPFTTSWRSKCPYQQPPPLILADGVEEAKWGDEERRAYVRRRRLLRRKPRRIDVNPLIAVVLPNMFLLTLLLWNPLPESYRQ